MWHVEQKNEICTLWRQDGAVASLPVPRSFLKQHAALHGLVADIYVDLCRQLDETGKATVYSADPLRFRQL